MKWKVSVEEVDLSSCSLTHNSPEYFSPQSTEPYIKVRQWLRFFLCKDTLPSVQVHRKCKFQQHYVKSTFSTKDSHLKPNPRNQKFFTNDGKEITPTHTGGNL